MLLHIEDHTTVGEVQERFTQRFPQLNILFYAEGYNSFGAPDSRYQYCGEERIGNIRPYYKKGAVEIKPWQSVSRVEQELKELYGLNAQIFCVSDDGAVLPTAHQKELTLQQQNELAARRESDVAQFAEA